MAISESRRLEILTIYEQNKMAVKTIARKLHTSNAIVSMVLKAAGHDLGRHSKKPERWRCSACGNLNLQSTCLPCYFNRLNIVEGKVKQPLGPCPKSKAAVPRLRPPVESEPEIREFAIQRSSRAITWK